MRDLTPPAPKRRTTHRLEPVGLSMAVSWREDRIVSIGLVEGNEGETIAEGPLGLWIRSWNKGLPLPGLPEDLLDWSAVPLRTRTILATLGRVPPGRTCTYADIAGWAGIPKGYQAVGQAMARNPFVLVVPCHRVLAKDGGLGGYSAGGPLVKRKLLEHEGWLP